MLACLKGMMGTTAVNNRMEDYKIAPNVTQKGSLVILHPVVHRCGSVHPAERLDKDAGVFERDDGNNSGEQQDGGLQDCAQRDTEGQSRYDTLLSMVPAQELLCFADVGQTSLERATEASRAFDFITRCKQHTMTYATRNVPDRLLLEGNCILLAFYNLMRLSDVHLEGILSAQHAANDRWRTSSENIANALAFLTFAWIPWN